MLIIIYRFNNLQHKYIIFNKLKNVHQYKYYYFLGIIYFYNI